MPTLLKTSCVSGNIAARRCGLFDEIEKIAEEKAKPPVWKRIARQATSYSAGYAAGHGAGMLVDAAAKKIFKNKWPNWSPEYKHKVLFPLMGIASIGVMVGAHASEMQRRKMLQGDE